MGHTNAQKIEKAEPAAAITNWPTHLQSAEAGFNALLDLLVLKNTITQQEADGLRLTTLNEES